MTEAVAFVPARSGSDRVPDKNRQRIAGRTLVQRAVRCALDAGLPVVVSTDSEAIWQDADLERRPEDPLLEWHARPEQLAGPASQIECAVRHWMLGPGALARRARAIVLLQPTSPLRRSQTVAECVRLLHEERLDSVTTVERDTGYVFAGRVRALWDAEAMQDVGHRVIWDRPVDEPPGSHNRPRTQDIPPRARENGAVYVFTREHFRRTGSRMGGRGAVVLMDRHEGWEVDTPGDLAVARAIWQYQSVYQSVGGRP